MNPRPLYRWKSFWLGVLVIAFLGWAWVRSIHRYDTVTWRRTGGRGIVVDHGYSQIVLRTSESGRYGIYSTRGRVYPPDRGFRVSLDKLHASRFPPILGKGSTNSWFPPLLRWSHDSIPNLIAYRSVHVSHWFLILLFLVPWSGWLAWRWRRLKSLQTEVEPNP